MILRFCRFFVLVPHRRGDGDDDARLRYHGELRHLFLFPCRLQEGARGEREDTPRVRQNARVKVRRHSLSKI